MGHTGVIRSRYLTLMGNVAYWSDQIKVPHTDGPWGILGRRIIWAWLLWQNLKNKHHFKDLGEVRG
jgi:hypothetical protein